MQDVEPAGLAVDPPAALDAAVTAAAATAETPLPGRRFRVVVAPDKFKGSLTAVEAAEAIGRGVREAVPDAEVRLLPIADGGEGTVDAAIASGFSRRAATVRGPSGDPVTATFALRDEAAVIEMAEASGLRRLTDGVPAPLTASTDGTGELVAAALAAGARRIVLGIGGSATTDGGAGMAQALGARMLDGGGADLPGGGGALVDLDRIDVSGLDGRLAGATVTVATDVDNPLTGPSGAAAVYGPQKGASADDVARLDAGLRRYAEVIERDLGLTIDRATGAGAAGGLGAGAMVFLGARRVSGVSAVLEIADFAGAIAGADLAITGEGSLDAQSLHGKAPIGVAAAAAAAGVPVVALAGRVELTDEQLRAAGICRARALLELQPDAALAQRDAAALLAQLAEDVVRSLPPR